MKIKVITEDVVMREADAWKRTIRFCALLVLSAIAAKCSGQTCEFTAPFSVVLSPADKTADVYHYPIPVEVGADFIRITTTRKTFEMKITGEEPDGKQTRLILDEGIAYVQHTAIGWRLTWITSEFTWTFYSFSPEYVQVKF